MLARTQIGMSDDQRDNEWGAQKRLYAAVSEMIAALGMAKECSSCIDFTDAQRAFSAFIHDELPSEYSWDEAISLARHP